VRGARLSELYSRAARRARRTSGAARARAHARWPPKRAVGAGRVRRGSGGGARAGYIGRAPARAHDEARMQGGKAPDSGSGGEAYVLPRAVSVSELARVLDGIDIASVAAGASLHFTQKRDGCVSLAVCGGAHRACVEYRLLDTTHAAEWPFVPESRPGIVARDRRLCAAWGLDDARISSVSLRARAEDPVEIRDAARLVLQSLQRAC